ncbi:hypothetical protein [Mycobacterium saskatchewanense]|nr:hypothetical protein [Mycobacterium saskatchewanense]
MTLLSFIGAMALASGPPGDAPATGEAGQAGSRCDSNDLLGHGRGR